ncbi:MAG: hypothetical protein L6R43_09470, partial [Planctomycetes bacterium]|nr:hypothetical protein [Planctomycetota bacterium]
DDATETRHLLYTLHPDPATAVAVELWIDGATLHPMGRRAWLATGTATLRLEESYASFRTEEITAADLP